MKQLISILIGCLVLIINTHAQNSAQLFNEAYSDYENGSYESGLAKLARLENDMGKTNAKIESLKTLLYNDKGDTRNALLSAEKYFRTNPDINSDGYRSIKELYNELKARMQSDFQSKKEQLERSRTEALSEVDSDLVRETDQYNYNIVRNARTLNSLETFLRNNSTKELRDSANALMNIIKQEQKQELLIREGIMLLEKGNFRDGISKLDAAQAIKHLGFVKNMLDEAWRFSRDHAIATGDMALLDQDWSVAMQNYEYAYKIREDKELKEKLLRAKEELEFSVAVRSDNANLVKKYISNYPTGRRRNHAEAFLFDYYFAAAAKDKKNKNIDSLQLDINELKALKLAKNWKIYSNAYYDIVLEHAKLMGQTNRKQHKRLIGREIATYEELDAESGKDYDSRIRSLKWRRKEWTRPGRFYLAYQTESSFTDVGLGIGYLSNGGLGFIFQARAPLQVWAAKEEESFETKGKTIQKGVINLLFTKKIVHPLHVYGGGGVAFVNRIFADPEEAGKGYVYTDEELTTPNVEAGIIIAVKPLTISAGVSSPFLSGKNKEHLGITKTPIEIAVGIGLAL